MYLASYSNDEENLVQGCVRLAAPQPGTDGLWWSTFGLLAESVISVPGWAAALRYTLTPGAGLEHHLVIAAPKDREAELRDCIAAFLRLDAAAEDSVEVPLSKERYDAMIARFPTRRCYVDSPFTQSDVWFAANFRVASTLDSLLAAAHVRGYRIGYQANLRAFRSSAAHDRAALLNASRAPNLAGVNRATVALQEKLARGLATASAVIDEYVAVETTTAAQWLERELDSAFADRFDQLSFASLGAQCTLEGYANQLITPVVRAYNVESSDYLCAHALQRAEAVAVLATRPSAPVAALYSLPARFSRPTAVAPSAQATAWVRIDLEPQVAPASAAASAPVFVSYKRQDLSRIAPIVELIRRTGRQVWFDQEIQGGMEWAKEIAERLRGSSALVVCLSQAAIDSRHVRHEVGLADARMLPVIPVRLEPVTLANGLDLFLEAIHQLDCTDPQFDSRFTAALEMATGKAAASRSSS